MKKLLLTALAGCFAMPVFAQTADTAATQSAPIEVFRTVQNIVELGKGTEQSVKTSAGAFDCHLVTKEGTPDRFFENNQGKACFGTDIASVSFLGQNHASDSFSLQWNFTDRKSFTETRDKLEADLKKIFGLAIKSNPGNLFVDRVELKGKNNRLVYLSWSTYGEWVKVEVLDEGAPDLGKDIGENIKQLIEAFPQGKGSLKNLPAFAETWGCVVKETGHPNWRTITSRVAKNCKNLNVYFEVEKDSDNIKSVKFMPFNPPVDPIPVYQQKLKEIYGQPQEVQKPLFEQPTQIYKAGDTAVVLNQVSLREKPNVEIAITTEEQAKK